MLHQSNNIPASAQQKLRKFLDDEALNILFDVLESKAFEHEVKAANQLLEARAGYDAEAKESVRKANTIHEAIALLKDLRAKVPVPFTVSTAKPSTKQTTKTT